MNQHNPFMYVEIAWIMIMFNNSHYLLFYFFSYTFLLLFAFFLPFLFIYIFSHFWFSFSFFISIWYNFCLTCIYLLFFFYACFHCIIISLVILLAFAFFCFLFLFVSFPFPFPLFSWFLLVLLNIIPLFTIHQTNWIVSYHIDSIIKRKYVGICFDSLCFLSVSLWFIYPLISFTISILANNNRINHVHRFETTIQILQIIVK